VRRVYGFGHHAFICGFRLNLILLGLFLSIL
jgi:hypothetical protein